MVETCWNPIPSGYVKIAIENGHRNSEFSHEKWWFSIVMLNYQRVNHGMKHQLVQDFPPKQAETSAAETVSIGDRAPWPPSQSPGVSRSNIQPWIEMGWLWQPIRNLPQKKSKMYCKNAILAVPSSWWLRLPNELYTVYYRHHNKSPCFFEVIIWDQLQIPMGSSELRTKSPPTWLVSQPPREKASAFLVNWWRKVVLNQLLMATNEDPNVYTACTIYIYLLYSIFPRSCIYNTEF